MADFKVKPAKVGGTKQPRVPGFSDENKATPRMIRRPAAFAKPDTRQPPIHAQKGYQKIQPIPDITDDKTKWGKTSFGRTGMTGES